MAIADSFVCFPFLYFIFLKCFVRQECNRMTLLYFVVSALDLLDDLPTPEEVRILCCLKSITN